MMYYSSCMLLFNLIYIFRMLYDYGNCFYGVRETTYAEIINTILFTIVLVFLAISIVSTIVICCSNDAPACKQTKGLKLKITDDITGNNYMGKFSLLVLTGLSLPINQDWLSLVLYLLIYFAIGIVYVKKRLYHINPIISLLNYSVYECHKENGKSAVVIIKDTKTMLSEITVKNIAKSAYIYKQRKVKYESNDKKAD